MFFSMLKDNIFMIMIIVVAFAIVAVATISMFCVCKMSNRNQVCNVPDNNESLTTRLGMSPGLIKFSVQELMQATNNFGESNLIGSGRFGPIYNGLIGNTLMVIKRISGSLRPRFVAEITYMSKIRHGNVVNILGYCCENGHQMIVYECLINLRALREAADLEFERRISIALGAAKGLQHLHSLTPPLTHYRFKTGKVLLDVNLNAKVVGAGLSPLFVAREEDADGLDLEVGLVGQESFDKTKDVYSFGLFLLELIIGEEPVAFTSNNELIQWIALRICTNTFVDARMNETYNREEWKSFVKIMLKCVKFPATKQPTMKEVVRELEKIHPADSTNEEAPTEITLGSELFTV